jgi:acyl-CoA reductase-like NAD-dependent aldehyde dehydrogenase
MHFSFWHAHCTGRISNIASQILAPQDCDANGNVVINGKLRPATGGKTADVVNPATGKVFTTVPHCSEADLNEAVASANAAFKSWGSAPFADRAACLSKFADLLEARVPEFAEALTKEQGKPLMFATGEVKGVVSECRELAKHGELKPEVRHEDAKARYEMHFVPRGVVGASE